METDRWNRIQQLYHAALEVSPSARAEFLSQSSTNDPEILREVESLLSFEKHADELLENPEWKSDTPSETGPSGTRVAIGAQIGAFRIVEFLGAGGMGEVYRAADTRLHRDVAIKMLPAEYAQQPEWFARFQREARAIAALSHPHICQLYDVGPNYLVMEYIEGKPLAGPLPLEKAVEYAAQILDALDAAHQKGITHRDLKPANIMVTKQGIKLLDFGLAKKTGALAGSDETLTRAVTQKGQILGTLQYMSPEQLQGKEADGRSDLFSFGCVMYEMLTGKRAFEGVSGASVIAAILEREPPSLKETAPAALDQIVRRCLAKDPEQRWQVARDLRAALDLVLRKDPVQRLRDISGAALPLEEQPASAGVRGGGLPWIVAGALAVIAAVALWAPWRGAPVADPPLIRFNVDLGPDAMTGLNLTVAISPDGRRLAYPARGPNGKQQLATRLLDQAQPTLLPGTEYGNGPFFSPDSQWIGFFAGGKLKKISAQGSESVTLCDAPFDYGASWGEDGTIIAAMNTLSGLSRLPASGGPPQPFTKLGKGETAHRWPQVLPGGQTILFTSSPTGIGMENASVEAVSLRSSARRTLVTQGYFGRYLPTSGGRGYLVYLHQGVLFGVSFDAARLEPQGTPVPLLEDVTANPVHGGGQFDFSATPFGHGTFVYLSGSRTQTWPVMWLDSTGGMTPLITPPASYLVPRFSLDGGRLALAVSASSGNDIYSYSRQQGTMTRLTFGGHATVPVWAPDGKHIAFESPSDGFGIEWMRSDGSGEPQRLLAAKNVIIPGSFSPDGRRLAYFGSESENGFDIFTLPLDTSDPDHPKPGKPEPFLATKSDELVPMFSPDGRWIAYRSNESGTNEIYVRPFPTARSGKWQISTGGGLYAIWSNNGREIFYETADYHIMVMDFIANGDTFIPGKSRLWSETQIFYPGTSNLALAPDGKRFAVLPMPEAAGLDKGSVHVTFLLNFLDELKRRIPAGK